MSAGKLAQMAKGIRSFVLGKAAAHRRGLSVIAVSSIIWLTLLLAGPTRSFAVQFLGLALFYGFLAMVLSRTSLWETARDLSASTRWSLFGVGAVFSVFFGWYFHRYHFFPTWDSITYWSKTLRFNSRLDGSIHSTLLNMLKSVNTSDYNDLQCWIASLPVRIFPQWAATFFIEAVMFLIPAGLILALFIFSRLKHVNSSINECLTVPSLFICLLSVPVFLRPVFLGYLDGIAALLFVAILVAVFDAHFPENHVLAALAGLGLCGTFLLRRWFVYGVIGLALAALLYWILILLIRRGEWMLLLRKLLVNLCIMAVVAGVTLLPFGGFLYHSMFGGQSTAYRSWTRWDSLRGKFNELGQWIGWFWIGAAIVATVAICVIAIVRHNRSMQETAAVLVAMPVGMLSALFSFWKIQDMSPQHVYIMIFFFEVLCFLSLMTICLAIRRARLQKVSVVAITVLAVVSLLHGFGMLAVLPSTLNKGLNNVTGAVIQQPIRQNDYNEKIRFTQFLRKKTDGTKLVYYAVASRNLNASLPISVCLPECSAALPFPHASADMDSRDGFNTRFFDADYVVTSTPISYSAFEKSEQVIAFLNQEVMDSNSVIGKHYRKIQTFTFANGYTDAARGTVKAYVYERTSDFSEDDVLYVKSVFHEKYPQLPKLFDDRFDSYLSQLSKKRSSQ